MKPEPTPQESPQTRKTWQQPDLLELDMRETATGTLSAWPSEATPASYTA